MTQGYYLCIKIVIVDDLFRWETDYFSIYGNILVFEK